jgi:endonuclease I
LLPLCLLLIACPQDPTDPDASISDHAVPVDSRPDTPDAPRPDVRVPDLWPSWPDLSDSRPHKGIEHLRDDALKNALLALVKDHTALGYNKAREAVFTVAGGGVDVVGGLIECVYTGKQVPADGTTAPGGFNTEHSWPKSDGADAEPAKSDLNHLFPSDASANSHRGSLPFGVTDCATHGSCTWSVGGSMIGPLVGGGGKVFMVRPAMQGDIARAHFYFSVRYGLSIPAAEELWLRLWNVADLPDARERDRAAAIEGLQSRRNPFVDRPDFVEQIGDF